jgi:predicted XRE-type DNA-binding protein
MGDVHRTQAMESVNRGWNYSAITEGQMIDTPLFDYPQSPGYRRTDTSREAAESIAPKAEDLRSKVMRMLRAGSMTADEIATILEIDKLSIRPRVSELVKMGKIYDTGMRHRNASGKRAVVWGAK